MPVQIEKWDYFELSLHGQTGGNPFLDVSFEADFNTDGRQLCVPGFYDGDGIFKLRFMPDRAGPWTFVTRSSAPELDGIGGELICTPPSAGNHGPVRVAHQTHFAYADGAAYIPVGTTCYVWNLQGDELEQRTLHTLELAPFNKMRMCVFPKRYRFNDNEPPAYPFAGAVTRPWDAALLDQYKSAEPPDFWDFERFNPSFFQHLEQRILDLRDRGIQADLILFHPYDFGAWGFDRMPPEVNQRYLAYLVARLAAFRNVWWSFANEYDLLTERSTEDWDRYFQWVQALDPYDHLRSVHNCFDFYDHTKPWVSHCSIQSHALNLLPVWIKKYGKPVVVDECGYEGDINMAWGDLSPEELVLRFWMGFCAGGYVGHGETYMHPEDILWWSKGGELHGESVARIAFLREVMEQAPAEGLQPIMKIDPLTLNPISGLRDELPEEARVMVEGPGNVEAAGFHARDYFLYYFGMHQPGMRHFRLPDGQYRVDLIDTWNMHIQTAFENASGEICVDLPGRKFIAVRIRKSQPEAGE